MSEDTLNQLFIFAAGIIIAWLMGWVRTFLAKRIKVKSPESQNIDKVTKTTKLHSFLIEASADRQSLHAKGSILLANAVKTGDQSQVDKALDLISASEQQYASSISARVMRNDDEIDFAENA